MLNVEQFHCIMDDLLNLCVGLGFSCIDRGMYLDYLVQKERIRRVFRHDSRFTPAHDHVNIRGRVSFTCGR